jgi:hypothetical protein
MRRIDTEEKFTVEPAVGNEVIALTPQEVEAHLQNGKALFKKMRYNTALKEFNAILKTAPGNIETRIWIRKTKQELTKPRTGVTTEEKVTPDETKRRDCIWVKMGLVSYRICTHNYDCLSCEFDQAMQEKMAGSESQEVDAALERFKKLPGNQRLCRYAAKGYISYRLCTRCFRCATCEFAQMREDALQKTLAKLDVRRQALGKKKSLVKA